MIELKDHIKISKVRKRMSPPIPLVMRDYHPILIRGWKFFNVLLSIRIFILNFIGGSNNSRFPLVHEG